MPETIQSITEVAPDDRIISHHRKFCADNGAQALAILATPGGSEYCVKCPSGLNAAGRKAFGQTTPPVSAAP